MSSAKALNSSADKTCALLAKKAAVSFATMSKYNLGAVQRSFVDSVDDSGSVFRAVSRGGSATGIVGSALVSFASRIAAAEEEAAIVSTSGYAFVVNPVSLMLLTVAAH